MKARRPTPPKLAVTPTALEAAAIENGITHAFFDRPDDDLGRTLQDLVLYRNGNLYRRRPLAGGELDAASLQILCTRWDELDRSAEREALRDYRTQLASGTSTSASSLSGVGSDIVRLLLDCRVLRGVFLICTISTFAVWLRTGRQTAVLPSSLNVNHLREHAESKSYPRQVRMQPAIFKRHAELFAQHDGPHASRPRSERTRVDGEESMNRARQAV